MKPCISVILYFTIVAAVHWLFVFLTNCFDFHLKKERLVLTEAEPAILIKWGQTNMFAFFSVIKYT